MTARVKYLVRDDARGYVERLKRGTYEAAAWTQFSKSARPFGLNIARSVATRNGGVVVQP